MSPSKSKRPRLRAGLDAALRPLIGQSVDSCYGVGAQQVKLTVSGKRISVTAKSLTLRIPAKRRARVCCIPLSFVVRYSQ